MYRVSTFRKNDSKYKEFLRLLEKKDIKYTKHLSIGSTKKVYFAQITWKENV